MFGSAHIPSAWHITVAGKMKERMEEYYQGERKDGGRKLKEKKEGKRVGGERRRGTLLNVVSSNFFVFSQVLGTFNFGPSLIQSMFPPQRAIPFSPFFTR